MRYRTQAITVAELEGRREEVLNPLTPPPFKPVGVFLLLVWHRHSLLTTGSHIKTQLMFSLVTGGESPPQKKTPIKLFPKSITTVEWPVCPRDCLTAWEITIFVASLSSINNLIIINKISIEIVYSLYWSTDFYWFGMSVHFKIHKTKGQRVDTSYGVWIAG